MSPTHVHKLKRHTYKTGTKVFFCTLPDCNYKITVQFALGKKCICNLCNAEFTMNEYSVKLAKPHCQNCSKVKVTDENGVSKFVRPNTVDIRETVEAKESVSNLKSRLEAITEEIIDEI